MACGMLPFQPVVVRAAAGDPKPEPQKGTWWAPIFKISSEPDYINNSDVKPVKARFEPGCFTEEKARRFRRMTSDAASFHDVMYHSAIASRLATDLSDGANL